MRLQQRISTPTCLYIAGSGRNGSTLLGMHLGRQPDIFFAGELTHIWRRGYLNDELCGCGEPFSRCEFWRAVTRAAFGKLPADDARHLARLRDRISPFWRIPSLVAGRLPKCSTPDIDYTAAYRSLLMGISNVSGSACVVDSSKYPTDLALLLRTRPVPLRVIHLVRDCNAVVFSWKRRRLRPEIHWKTQFMPRYDAVTTALAWRLFNTAIEQLSRGSGVANRLLRYEDLVGTFPATLAGIVAWLGSRPLRGDRANHHVAHTVSGNPCRFNATTSDITLDDEWRRRVGPFDRMVVTLLCGRQQRLYGYGQARQEPARLEPPGSLVAAPAPAVNAGRVRSAVESAPRVYVSTDQRGASLIHHPTTIRNGRCG